MGTVETCMDDFWEDNDTRAQAAGFPLAADLYEFVSCPAPSSTFTDDEDFYEIVTTGNNDVAIELSGESSTDLDLALLNSTGGVIQSEVTTSSDHTIERCLTAGTYYIRVNAYNNLAGDPLTQNDYLLSYSTASVASCAAACVDDSNENDDTLATARTTTYPTHTQTGRTICTDDDWYEVPLFNGEVMTVDLTFTHAMGDLDLTWHNSAGTDLSGGQGQGSVDNEHYEFTAPATGCAAGCDYYVKVHGYNGAKNTYGITIAIE
jgi:hypothetical protein